MSSLADLPLPDRLPDAGIVAPRSGDQFRALVSIQWAKVRQGWIFHFALPIIGAIGIVWLRKFALQGTIDEPRFVTGAVVCAAMFSTLNPVAHDAAVSRIAGELDYIASLPVRWSRVLVSMAVVPVTLAIPAMIAVVVAASSMLGVDISLGPSLFLGLLLLLVLLIECGLLVGISLDPRTVSLVASALPMLLLVSTPILITPEAAPAVMRFLGTISPLTAPVQLLQDGLFAGSGDVSTIALAYSVLVAVGLGVLVVRQKPVGR